MTIRISQREILTFEDWTQKLPLNVKVIFFLVVTPCSNMVGY